MTSTNPMLRLPPERIEQLKSLTAALGLASTAETIGHLIREKVAERVIPDTIPGMAINADADHVVIGIGEAPPIHYPKATAKKIAATIRQVANGDATGTADIAGDYIVMRQGNGVRLHFPLTAPAKSVSPDIARDIARLIEAETE